MNNLKWNEFQTTVVVFGIIVVLHPWSHGVHLHKLLSQTSFGGQSTIGAMQSHWQVFSLKTWIAKLQLDGEFLQTQEHLSFDHRFGCVGKTQFGRSVSKFEHLQSQISSDQDSRGFLCWQEPGYSSVLMQPHVQVSSEGKKILNF